MNHSKTGASLSSTTRLSASAKPFMLNRCTHQPTSKFPVHSGPEPAINSCDHCSSDPFGSLLDSFSKFNLGAKGNSVVSAPLGAAATFPVGTASQTKTQEESFSHNPTVEFQGDGDLIVLNGSDFDNFKEFSPTVYCSNIAGLGYDAYDGSELDYGKQGKDYHESLVGNGSDGGGSAADRSILPKGKHAVDGLNFYKEASDGIFSKGTDSILGKDILLNSRGKIQAGAISSSVLTSNCEDAPFIFSTLDMSSSAKLKNSPHNQGCYAPSVVTYSDFISSGASDGLHFSKVPSCVRNVASDSIGNHPAALHGSSASSGPFPFDSFRNMDFLTGSCGTIEDKGCSSSSTSGTRDSFVILNADGKGTDDGNKEQNRICKSVSSGVTDYSTNTPNEVTLTSHGTGGGISIKTSSKSLGDSESDLDSPCWKGTMTFSKSPWENSGSVHSQHFEKELEKCKSLNPLAPQFFPSNAEGSIYRGGKKDKAVNLLPGEDRQINTVMAEAPPVDLKKGVELLHSNDMYEREKAFKLVNDPKCSFVLNPTCMTQPVSVEEYSTMKRTIGAAVDLEGYPKETKDSMARGSIRDSFPTKCHSPSPSSSPSQAGVVNDIFKTLQGVSKSLIGSPKLDVQIMVNAMHVLSELLVQTCAHGLDSYKEHDHDTVQRIINNLNVFSTSYNGQMIPTLKSTYTGSPYFPGRSSELSKHPRKGVEVESIETSAVPKKLHYQNDKGGLNCVSKVTGGRGQYSLSSSSDVGAEKGNEILQVIRRNLSKIQDTEEHLLPQALLYKNLWLDAEAALCYMRRKIYLRLMETGMDVNHTDFVDLWR